MWLHVNDPVHNFLILPINPFGFLLLADIVQALASGSLNLQILLVHSALLALGDHEQLVEQVLIISFNFNYFFYSHQKLISN